MFIGFPNVPMSASRNLLIILVTIILFVLAGAYLLFGISDTPTVDGNTLAEESGSASTAERQFLALIASLEPTHLDLSLLSHPRFMSLVDIHQSIIMEDAGRANPFAPLVR